MPKIKTRKSAAKRFKLTKRGKLLRGKTGLNHLMRKKPSDRVRRLKQEEELHGSYEKRMRRLLPYL